ncbi:uncharacterized protein EDB91DRAFT_1254286 [Suillus paluster]|uniref:uncharacterized protein n=1 Tax=Suillus paluster TaxID=48578 RepID=UPI001B8734EF|nr:uncharacterized protein EDB91DRAFT_1254286 [Suillus paluster]KAG1726512.1 hypothetical protein EDB91DRAFT_1254286 [Suillus paluster]
MSLTLELNQALAVTDASLCHALCWIKIHEADGSVVIDQAHAVTRLVSTALQQHGRNASLILLLLLSAAAEVRVTMNQGIAPQWAQVRDNDTRMESHPFFPKTVGYVAGGTPEPAPQVAPAPAPAPTPAPMSVPLIESLPTTGHQHNLLVPGTMTGKGKQPACRTQRSQEDSLSTETGQKKRKVSRPLSKALVSNTKDEDGQPGGTVVVVKPASPLKSKGMTKGIKKTHAEDTIGRTPAKGKGKEKAKEVAEPIRGRPLAKADAGAKTECSISARSPSTHSVIVRSTLQECDQLMSVHSDTPVPMAHPRSRAAPASKKVPPTATPRSKSNGLLRRTRATSRARPPTPILESEEEAVKATDVSITGDDDANMEPTANAPAEPAVDDKIVVDEPRAIASADDFPADHWVEPNSDYFIIPTAAPAAGDVSLPSASLPPAVSAIHECVVSLAAKVTAMQLADKNTLARVDAFDLGTTVNLVNGLTSLVEKLQQAQTIANPLFPPPMMSNFGATSATPQMQVMGIRYLNGVYSPSVATSASAADPSASRPFGRPDMHGDTFTSGQASSMSAHASPSSAPAVVGPHSAGTSPASAAKATLTQVWRDQLAFEEEQCVANNQLTAKTWQLLAEAALEAGRTSARDSARSPEYENWDHANYDENGAEADDTDTQHNDGGEDDEGDVATVGQDALSATHAQVIFWQEEFVTSSPSYSSPMQSTDACCMVPSNDGPG